MIWQTQVRNKSFSFPFSATVRNITEKQQYLSTLKAFSISSLKLLCTEACVFATYCSMNENSWVCFSMGSILHFSFLYFTSTWLREPPTFPSFIKRAATSMSVSALSSFNEIMYVLTVPPSFLVFPLPFQGLITEVDFLGEELRRRNEMKVGLF